MNQESNGKTNIQQQLNQIMAENETAGMRI